MQPPKAIALTNAFFSSGVLMEDTELFGREGSSTLLESDQKNLLSNTGSEIKQEKNASG